MVVVVGGKVSCGRVCSGLAGDDDGFGVDAAPELPVALESSSKRQERAGGGRWDA